MCCAISVWQSVGEGRGREGGKLEVEKAMAEHVPLLTVKGFCTLVLPPWQSVGQREACIAGVKLVGLCSMTLHSPPLCPPVLNFP